MGEEEKLAGAWLVALGMGVEWVGRVLGLPVPVTVVSGTGDWEGENGDQGEVVGEGRGLVVVLEVGEFVVVGFRVVVVVGGLLEETGWLGEFVDPCSSNTEMNTCCLQAPCEGPLRPRPNMMRPLM